MSKHHSEETKKKIGNANRGKNNGNWKGDEAKPEAGRLRAERMYECPKGMQRHHKDGNPLNNTPENIAFVSAKQHVKIDGRTDKLHQSNIGNKYWLGKHHSKEARAKMSAFAKTRQRERLKNGRFGGKAVV